MLGVTGCVALPQIETISKDCLWSEKFEWTLKEADILTDCCPELADNLYIHNKLYERHCE